MKMLSDVVRVDRRFQRSARIDSDLTGDPPLGGYILQASVRNALAAMATSLHDGRQTAFTWTGPYGGGKSSAALLVGSLVGGAKAAKALATDIAGPELTGAFREAFPEDRGPWKVVAVTGRRRPLREALAEAAAEALGWARPARAAAQRDDHALIEALLASAQSRGGVLLIIDELGKLLEHELAEDGDIHLLQDLAELGSRSQGALVVVGILHQGFDHYAARVGRDGREEWAKIQGRFQDIPFLAAADETVSLLARAIDCDVATPEVAAFLSVAVTASVAQRRPADKETLATALASAWPLHPITALLLGPVSRQRFAQNERSVFGFLSSAEPNGLREHLERTAVDDPSPMFRPDQLWDYLVANFGMVLTQGNDGKRFSLAFEAVERAASRGGPLHSQLTKTAALIEFFRNGTGLAVADDILAFATDAHGAETVAAAVQDLVEWAILIRQARIGGYALFAGSDFDLDEAIGRVRQKLDAAAVHGLPAKVGIGSVPAKRHYFVTGALRTFETRLQLVSEADIKQGADNAGLVEELTRKRSRGSGWLVLMMSDGEVTTQAVDRYAKSIQRRLKAARIVAAVGAAGQLAALRDNTADLIAIDRVARDHPQLEGDRIARRELAARRSLLLDALQHDVIEAFESACWYFGPSGRQMAREPLSVLASAVADAAFDKTPILRSELLQRDRPSSSAMAAVRELGHAMIESEPNADLKFENYPAERGLYMTVVQPFGLHQDTGEGFAFGEPNAETPHGKSLMAAWSVIEAMGEVTLDEVFDIWAAAPFGVKRGVMPVLALAYILARRNALAVYQDGTFQSSITTVFFDRLLQNPALIRLKRVERTAQDAAFVKDLIDRLQLAKSATPLDVAKAVYERFELLNQFAKRTTRLDDMARAVRDVVLRASDPEALLFRDLTPVLEGQPEPAAAIVEAIRACEASYPALLSDLRRDLAAVLGASASFEGVAGRATNIHGVTGDLRFQAFAMRVADFDGGAGDVEGLASMLVHRPPHAWSDHECDQAVLELARMGRMFRETEALAAVQGRKPLSEAMAVVVGIASERPPIMHTFELTAGERREADALADQLLDVLANAKEPGALSLAALARAVERISVPARRELAQ